MFFYASTSAGPRGWCYSPSLNGEGFNDPWGVQQMLVHQKTMFDCYYCIKSFCLLKLWKNALKRSFFECYNGAQKHEGFVGIENACSIAYTYVILTSLINVHFYARYCWWHQFLWRPRMHICKVQNNASTARELPD